MEDKDRYVPMNKLIKDKDTSWTFTSIDLSYHEIARRGIVIWCVKNLEGRWTMLGGNKFGFEDAADATIFRMQFGFGIY
jgi:hypothetical protein